VPTKRGPTLRSQRLGQRLRKLREDAGLTLREVASYVQRDASSISRMESGIHPARVPDVLAYVTLCGVSDGNHRATLVRLAQDAWQTGWWDRYQEDALESVVDLAWLEARAVEIRSFHALVIPGLLQTSSYATAVMRASDHGIPVGDIDRWVAFRLTRQKIFESEGRPRLHVVLDESVLHRLIGGPDVMREQLDHLIDLTGRPGTTISILPWTAGAHASPEGCFDVLQMEEPYSAVGYAETPGGAVFLEREDVDRLIDRHGRLSSAALSPADSVALLRRISTNLARHDHTS
jgi:transcriptional regulator with XRE-family HTH domain